MQKSASQLIPTLLLFLLPLSLVACDDDHGNYSFTFKGRTYEIVKDRKTWQDAASYARKRGAKLVEINSAEEQNAIFYELTHDASVSPEYASVTDGGGIAYLWIGATDKQKEGQWIWDGTNSGKGPVFWTGQGANGKGDGTATNAAYIYWGGTSEDRCNEPDNYAGHQNAAAIALADWPKGAKALGHAGEWNDINESNKLYFVIEYVNK